MSAPPFLVESIGAIREKLGSLVSYRDLLDSPYYESLDPRARDQYIKNYETFWFSFHTLSGLIDELLFLFTELQRQRTLVLSSGVEHRFYTAKACSAYWRLIVSDVYTLICWFSDWCVLPEDWKKRYRELRYIQLLRNAFAQHPDPARSFDVIGMITSTRHDERFLPSVAFGPQASGSPTYLSHYQSKAGPRAESHEVLQQENKQLFIDKNGWGKYSKLNENQKAQLKGWGLPEIDQERFSVDLPNLFNVYAFPRLQALVEEAKYVNVVRTARARRRAVS